MVYDIKRYEIKNPISPPQKILKLIDLLDFQEYDNNSDDFCIF